jgi:hypothetical protein
VEENHTHLEYKGCFLKFGVEVGFEESIVNALHGSRISCLNLAFYTSSQSTLQRQLPHQIKKKKTPLQLQVFKPD